MITALGSPMQKHLGLRFTHSTFIVFSSNKVNNKLCVSKNRSENFENQQVWLQIADLDKNLIVFLVMVLASSEHQKNRHPVAISQLTGLSTYKWCK